MGTKDPGLLKVFIRIDRAWTASPDALLERFRNSSHGGVRFRAVCRSSEARSVLWRDAVAAREAKDTNTKKRMDAYYFIMMRIII